VRYAYAITTALLIGGTAATMAFQSPSSAQVAQNEPGTISVAGAPKPGAPLSFADLAAKLQPAVVNISTKNQVEVPQNPFAGTPFGDLFGGGQGGQQGGSGNGRPVTREATSLGSGFIISEDGYIVTNSHVVSGGRPGNPAVGQITVIMPDRKEYAAKLVGRDASSDLAVLKIEARGLSGSAIRSKPVSATGWSRSAIPMVSAGRSRRGSFPRSTAISVRVRMTAISRPMRRSIRAIRAARCSI
jgi:serine protease Do